MTSQEMKKTLWERRTSCGPRWMRRSKAQIRAQRRREDGVLHERAMREQERYPETIWGWHDGFADELIVNKG
jgi:hypothetical protein